MSFGIANILNRRIKLNINERMFYEIKNLVDYWIVSESWMPYMNFQYPPIFNDVLCLSYDEDLHLDIFEKQRLSISEIHDLRRKFSQYKFAIFASFVPLFKKPKFVEPMRGFGFDDFIISARANCGGRNPRKISLLIGIFKSRYE